MQAQATPDPSVQLLLREDLRLPVEARISSYLGREWRVTEAHDRTDEASHPAAVLSDGKSAFFVKAIQSNRAWDQASREIDGLQLLTSRSGVLTPAVVGAVNAGGDVLLILVAVEVLKKQDETWREIGKSLASIHRVEGESFGLETHTYLGSLCQDNTQTRDWIEFFRQRRLQPRLKAAFDSGRLPLQIVSTIEKISARLPELCGSQVAPALLHGDAHTNNILHTSRGPVFIDPAIYFGHPEMDLASLDFFVLAYPGYFTPVPDEFYQGYQELMPIDPGYAWRRDLWRIPNWLAMIELDGPRHVGLLLGAIRHYI